ncbi:hypothetical protein VA249_25010 [Vibrio alfacsensis]|uniref:formyltransferase family protein n=1 Tax=Vibrio alfacsensis TaxID=1074311 RepID=UPI001BF12C0E|nr:formyltransferase family protein [Vibrio alfacsensis]BBM65855.1 hypothetical protein VA249_25010 [Vibrio alfacsensis]
MNIVIYTPSKSVKGNVVVDYLFNNRFFTENFSVFIIVDKESLDFNEKYESKFKIFVDDGQFPECLTNIDYIITVGWGGIIRNDVISRARCAALNCHSSMLPDYKGGSAYNHYWANCEDFSGATIHYLTSKVDSGNIVAQSTFKLSRKDSPMSILQRASELTGPLLIEALLKTQQGYRGELNNGGRYFFKVRSKYQLVFYRILNLSLKKAGLKRKLMPYKYLD